jgi:Family of unknown function (DUF6496)
MPNRETVMKARRDAKEGKAPSTQAGEFVREEIEHVREGEHGARSAKQAIAIGLSKARRAGVKLPPPDPSKTSKSTRRKAKQDSAASKIHHKPSTKRARATKQALRREGAGSISHEALAKQAHKAALSRSQKSRSVAAKKGAAKRQRRK